MDKVNNHNDAVDIPSLLDRLYRTESRRIYASLVRLLGDFDHADEALQDAFAAAADTWAADGVPENPRAWLISAGRFKAIDAQRRRGVFHASRQDLAERAARIAEARGSADDNVIEDDQLRLVFTCCHPAIDRSVQIPLTLREVCGLTKDEIARAFLVAPSAMAQRLVRGKTKIRDAGIPIEIPENEELPQRLESVLAVVYLVFNEGYSASRGTEHTRADLCQEAIRLGRLIVERLPEPEAIGLLALMLLQDSRRLARTGPDGDIILLEFQDRSSWNTAQITEGLALLERVPVAGSYLLQAAIAAEHAKATTAAATDWRHIVRLYGRLCILAQSPVVELNAAVALAMADGPDHGLAKIDAILARGELTDFHLAHAARADCLRRLGHRDDAREAYERALSLAQQEPERRFLIQRLMELNSPA